MSELRALNRQKKLVAERLEKIGRKRSDCQDLLNSNADSVFLRSELAKFNKKLGLLEQASNKISGELERLNKVQPKLLPGEKIISKLMEYSQEELMGLVAFFAKEADLEKEFNDYLSKQTVIPSKQTVIPPKQTVIPSKQTATSSKTNCNSF